AVDEPEVHRAAGLVDVLVDLAVREPGQRGVVRGHEDLGLRRARSQRPAQDILGQPERLGRRIAGAHPRAGAGAHGRRGGATGRVRCRDLPHHLPTPTWTSRNRAPETAWPTWAPWPGSPLPQFGVPSIT